MKATVRFAIKFSMWLGYHWFTQAVPKPTMVPNPQVAFPKYLIPRRYLDSPYDWCLPKEHRSKEKRGEEFQKAAWALYLGF